MNKQEAIEKIKGKSLFYEDDYTGAITVIDLDDAQEIISQIDEPQKVVVPKFVAEWLEKSDWRKDTLGRQTIFDVFDNLTLDASNGYYADVKKWVEENGNIFAQAFVFGYEVEKEKLYTVEIPDPHGLYKIRYLCRDSNGDIRIGSSDDKDIFSTTETHLTEAEIKKGF